MQARRLLDSPAFFAAGAAAYCILLLTWLQCGALDEALATLRTCSPLPSVSAYVTPSRADEDIVLIEYHIVCPLLHL